MPFRMQSLSWLLMRETKLLETLNQMNPLRHKIIHYLCSKCHTLGTPAGQNVVNALKS